MKIALLGNPGAGKSLIFNQLTGLGIEVNRYPGSSVCLECGNVCYKKEKIEIVDLPGIYSLDGSSEEEILVRKFLEQAGADVIVAILDATKLERSLYLFLQVAEFSPRIIAVLNMIDEAEKQGLIIDIDTLSARLGVPVLLTAASEGRDVDRILPLALGSSRVVSLEVPYDHHVEAALKSLEKTMGTPRSKNLLALQGTGEDPMLLDSAGAVAHEIELRHRMSVRQIIATNRHNLSRKIAASAVSQGDRKKTYDLDSLLTRVFPGVPILCAILFFLLLSVFVIGSWMQEIIVQTFTAYIIVPFVSFGITPLVGKNRVFSPRCTRSRARHRIPVYLHVLCGSLSDRGYRIHDPCCIPCRPCNAPPWTAWRGDYSHGDRIWLHGSCSDEFAYLKDTP